MISEHEIDYEQSKRWAFEMYAEYSDGYSCYVYDKNEDYCIWEIGNLIAIHGEVLYYTGVENEDRTAGEWVGRENYIY